MSSVFWILVQCCDLGFQNVNLHRIMQENGADLVVLEHPLGIEFGLSIILTSEQGHRIGNILNTAAALKELFDQVPVSI